MARARNIKPGFFTNEQLADQSPLGRLLFIGLWTIADYKGELEWKERTIKVQLLPFDDCDIKELAINLDKSGLIRFYSRDDQIYINIPNFTKHQNPHKNEREKGSDIPPFTDESMQAIDLQGLTINRDKNGTAPDKNGTAPADSLFLIPDSCSLKPDAGILIPLGSEGKKKPSATGSETELQQACKQVWQQYSTAYYQRYQVEPVRNAKVNGQVKSFVKRIGYDNAPHVAAHFVSSNTAYYVSRGHSVDCLLSDAEKLHTEWATGKSITQTRARQIDKSESNKNAVSEAIQILKDRGI